MFPASHNSCPYSFFYAKIYLIEIICSMLMTTFRHRGRVTIFAEILKATGESERGKKKTDIMYGVNLNYFQASKYLRLLLINGLLCLDAENRYRLTKRGLEIIKKLEFLSLRLE